MEKVNFSKVFIAIVMITMFVGCSGGNRSVSEEKVELDEPVKSFLKNSLQSNYSFYTLKAYLPIEMSDLRSNGIRIASRIPDGLLPPDVINVLYRGGFLSGTVVSLDEGTNGMEKFDGIKLNVTIGVTPDGCVNSLREDNVKSVILFSDEDFKRITDKDLVKIVF